MGYNNYYAILDGSNYVKKVVRTDEPTSNMVKCNYPVFKKNRRRYVGRLPKKGYKWTGKSFINE